VLVVGADEEKVCEVGVVVVEDAKRTTKTRLKLRSVGEVVVGEQVSTPTSMLVLKVLSLTNCGCGSECPHSEEMTVFLVSV
jgi:hypothetical protein